MIIVKLMGGLGNQMFQYAAARSLAQRHNTEVAMDCSFLANPPPGDTPRQYFLDSLAVKQRFASVHEIAEIGGLYRSVSQKVLLRIRRLACIAKSENIFREKGLNFCPEFLGLPDNVYLDGFWQSERYFADIAEIIRKEFAVSDEPRGRNLELAGRIKSTEGVSVHFRRGDYLNSAKTAAYHGLPGIDYYHRALDKIREYVSDPKLFVFSDEPDWVRQNIEFPVPFEIVDHNPPERGVEDLRLMSCCRHAIIANSSFSWWGAWLITNPQKMVVAPSRWFAAAENDPVDLIPDSWIRV